MLLTITRTILYIVSTRLPLEFSPLVNQNLLFLTPKCHRTSSLWTSGSSSLVDLNRLWDPLSLRSLKNSFHPEIFFYSIDKSLLVTSLLLNWQISPRHLVIHGHIRSLQDSKESTITCRLEPSRIPRLWLETFQPSMETRSLFQLGVLV
jgi:hypothetical protein